MSSKATEDPRDDRLSLGGRQALASVRAALFEGPVDAVMVGKYELLERLGMGASGTVYAAYDAELDRRVAIKLLRSDRSSDATVATRFVAEGRTLAKLDHPNVVAVYGAGVGDDGPFIAMQLVDGWTLDAWIDETEPPLQRVLDVVRAAGRGLAAAHRGGFVHRDFKPANVLVARDGQVRVADFGLARLLGMSDERVTHDEVHKGQCDAEATIATKGVVGTPMYMSPEQRRGEPVSAASDQYSFCLVAWEALAGRPASPDGVLTTLPPRPASMPRRVHAVLARGLSPRVEDRWPSMSDLDRALDRAINRPARVRWVTLGGCAALLGIGAVLWWPSLVTHAFEPVTTLEACHGVDGAMASSWDEAKRSHVAEVGGATTLERLDHHAARWRDLRTQVCSDRIERRVAEPLTHVRIGCLDRSLAVFDEAVGLAMKAPSPAHADAMVDRILEDPTTCLAPQSSLMTPWRPDDPALVRRGDAALARASRLWGALTGGLVDERDRLVDELEGELTALEPDPWPHGAVSRVLGHASQDPSRREQMFRAAWADGLRSRNDELAIYGCVDLGDHLRVESRAAEALGVLDACLATVDRMDSYAEGHEPLIGLVPLVRGQVLNTRSVARRDLGDVAGAEADLRAAIAAWANEADPPAKDRLIQAYNNLADLQKETGKLGEALAGFRRARDLTVELLGPEHGFIPPITMNIGATESALGHPEAAERAFEKARSMLVAQEGAEALSVAGADLDIAGHEIAYGRLAEAETRANAARTNIVAQLPPTHMLVAFSHVPACRIAMARASSDAADRCRAAADAISAALGPTHYATAEARLEAVAADERQAPDRRLAEIDEIVTVLEASVGLENRRGVLADITRGGIELARGRLTAAHDAFERALTRTRACTGGEENPWAVDARIGLALALPDPERRVAACTTLERELDAHGWLTPRRRAQLHRVTRAN